MCFVVGEFLCVCMCVCGAGDVPALEHVYMFVEMHACRKDVLACV